MCQNMTVLDIKQHNLKCKAIISVCSTVSLEITDTWCEPSGLTSGLDANGRFVLSGTDLRHRAVVPSVHPVRPSQISQCGTAGH